MDTTRDRETGRPDLPMHTRRASPKQDRRRAVWILLAVVAAAIVAGLLLGELGADAEPALPASGSAAGAQAPVAAPTALRGPVERMLEGFGMAV